jgi:HEXXH motif-containing protein
MNAVHEASPAWLVVPEAGDHTVADLQAAVRKIALKQLLGFPATAVDAPLRRPLKKVRQVLTDLLRTQPAVVTDALANPDVLTPLLVLDVGERLTGHSATKLLSAALPALLVHLAHRAKRGAVPEALLWDLPLDQVPDATGFRHFVFAPDARGLLVDPLGLEFRLHAGTDVRVPEGAAGLEGLPGVRTERPFHRLHTELPRLQFSLFDSNPLSMFEAHPDKDGNAISLGDQPLERWLRSLREALDMIRLTLPTWFEEAKVSARRFVPVGYLPERHLSASYREAPGVAYLTLCENPMTIAEAIVHEIQHTKANLLSWVDPILHNAHTCWTQSPVRPDLRPLWGVLLAVHAFVPVALMHERLAAMNHPVTTGDRFLRRRLEVLQGNHRGMKGVLENAEPTERGKRLVTEMSALHDRLRSVAPAAPPGLEIDPDILPPG